MSIEAKVKVKSLLIKKGSRNADQERAYEYIVSFMPVDKSDICEKTFFEGIEKKSTTDVAAMRFPVDRLETIVVCKVLFDFLSDHSKETFIITIDDSNGKRRLEEVELIYG